MEIKTNIEFCDDYLLLFMHIFFLLVKTNIEWRVLWKILIL